MKIENDLWICISKTRKISFCFEVSGSAVTAPLDLTDEWDRKSLTEVLSFLQNQLDRHDPDLSGVGLTLTRNFLEKGKS